MDPPEKAAYLKCEHQERLIEGLRQFHDRIIAVSQKCLEETNWQYGINDYLKLPKINVRRAKR